MWMNRPVIWSMHSMPFLTDRRMIYDSFFSFLFPLYLVHNMLLKGPTITFNTKEILQSFYTFWKLQNCFNLHKL